MNWRKLLKAALIAAASGAVGAVAQSAQEGAKPEALQTAAIAGAVLGLVGHLTQSPIEKRPETPPDVVGDGGYPPLERPIPQAPQRTTPTEK